jgi:hypothetical protein
MTELPVLTTEERLVRVERALTVGLNVDLFVYGTPEHQAQQQAALEQEAADELAGLPAAAEAARAAQVAEAAA